MTLISIPSETARLSATGDGTVLTTRDPTYPQIVIDHLPKIEALCKGRVRFEGETIRCRRAPDGQDQAAEVLEVCPTLCWREMDSNHRYPGKKQP